MKMSLLGVLMVAAVAACGSEPVDFVDPSVGTAGTGHTFPAACVPFGMVQAGPDTGYGDWD